MYLQHIDAPECGVDSEKKTMNTNFGQQPTARIYEFPTRSLAAVRFRQELNVIAAREAAGVKVVHGSCWYHDEAIEKADHGLKS